MLLDLVLILKCLELLFLLEFYFISIGSFHPEVVGNRKVFKVIEVRVYSIELGLLLLVLCLLISCETNVVKRHRHLLLVVLVPNQVFGENGAELRRDVFRLVFIVNNFLNCAGIPHAV